MPPGMRRRAGAKRQGGAHGEIVAAVEIIANGLIAHPANKPLRIRVLTGEVTPSELSDAAQRIALGMAVLHAAERRGLHNDSLRTAINDRVQSCIRPESWQRLRVALESLEALGLISQGRAIVDCDLEDEELLAAKQVMLGKDSESANQQVVANALWIGEMHERLLETNAVINRLETKPLARFSLQSARKSRRRKSGSFYTPEGLVKHLLDVTLKPAIDDVVREVDASDAARMILRLRVCDPSCGTGHFLVAAARMLAERLAEIRGDESTQAMREVIENCVFGVDLNPLAAEICRSMLWLETSDRRFDPRLLRGHIKCGHALLGAPTASARESEMTAEKDDADAWCDRHRRGMPADSAVVGPGYFHWHLEFPDVFLRPSPGFDVVIGNPPFLNQLETDTAIERSHAAIMRARSNGVMRGYADVASAFLLLATDITRAGGRISLVQPQSLLAARDSDAIRKAVLARASLQSIWVANERMFDAHVFTCAPMLQRDGAQCSRLARHVGSQFELLPSVTIEMKSLAAEETWAALVADASGIPQFSIPNTQIVGHVATATADFRDQYYGLDQCLTEDASLTPSHRCNHAFPPLVTTGLIDLAFNAWRTRPTRVLKREWLMPRINRAALERDPDLTTWLHARLVPKIVLATQTRIIELFVDEAGEFVPSVPLITIIVQDPARLWHVAAALASPVCTAIALRRFGGTAMTIDAIKLSARQVLQLPVPAPSVKWDAAADTLRDAHVNELDATTRREKLARMADLMIEAYDVPHPQRGELLDWWVERAEPRTKGRAQQVDSSRKRRSKRR